MAMFSEFSVGTFLEDADVTVKQARFIRWDYKGKIKEPVLGLQLNLVDAEGKDHEEVLSAGELKFFVPSPDGKVAMSVGKQQFLNVNTNAVQFMIDVMNADTKGEFAAKFKATDDISILDGLKFHAVQKKQPKRESLVKEGTDAKEQEAKTRLSTDKIIAYPWENGVAFTPTTATVTVSSAQAAPVAAPVAAAPAVSSANDQQAIGLIMEVLATNGGTVKKNMLVGLLFASASFKSIPEAPVRNSILAMVANDAFLLGAAAASGVKYNQAAGEISL